MSICTNASAYLRRASTSQTEKIVHSPSSFVLPSDLSHNNKWTTLLEPITCQTEKQTERGNYIEYYMKSKLNMVNKQEKTIDNLDKLVRNWKNRVYRQYPHIISTSLFSIQVNTALPSPVSTPILYKTKYNPPKSCRPYHKALKTKTMNLVHLKINMMKKIGKIFINSIK